MTVYVILLVKVPTEHLGRLINSVFDFDGHTSSRLRLLYDLKRRLLAQKACETSGTYVLRLVVNFKRSAIKNVSIPVICYGSNTHIFPRSMISFFCVTGSILTTHRGVPTRNVPSRISTPKMIGSRFVKAAIVLSLHGHTA